MSSKVNDFQFELNEALYFNHGDEVLELVGISLNPDITIDSNDTDIFMRGEIELRGEYIRDEEAREDDMDESETKRFVNEVENKEEQTATFIHHFPVDITVPASRVENIDDVRIEIVNFDYELPINSKLQFTATAEIQGIKAEEIEETEGREEPIRTEYEREAGWDSEFPPFEFEVERQENEFEPVGELEVPVTEETEEPEKLEEEPELEEREIEEVTAEDDEMTEKEKKKKSPQENELTIRAMEEDDEEEVEQREEEVRDVSYLTDIFRDEEEESYTKMKICIVQEEDTIESIAERFQISALQLIKQNKLDDDFDVMEGQLLYIPKK